MYDLEKLELQIDSPEKLHELANNYNWDYGLEVLKWIINHPLCDRGTALLIYWRAGPRYHYQYATREEVPVPEWDKEKHNLQKYDFICEVEEKYLSGKFTTSFILFNPRFDKSEGMVGYNWSQKYLDEPVGRKIPEEMFKPSISDEEWEKLGRPDRKNQTLTLDDLPFDDFFDDDYTENLLRKVRRKINKGTSSHVEKDSDETK